MWVTECIPAWCTSVLVVVLLLLTCSTSSLWFFNKPSELQELGKSIRYKDLMACFADPTIMLFLGGFTLAAAASKTGIDVNMTRVLMKPFGKKSTNVLLGFILITGIFSMFMSNTATAAMMLTFLAPIFKTLPVDGKGKIGLALAIPLGANIGGIGTPIGTPPNAIALKFMNDPDGLNLNVGFGEWVSIMMPFTLILLFISWLLLRKMFPFTQPTIELNIEGKAKKGWQTIVVYITFIVTIILWVLDKVTGLNANVVAMIPIAVFCVTGIFGKEELANVDWSVLWMVAGGFALGVALNDTNLAKDLIATIPFATWSPVFVIIGAGLLCWVVSNIISHTATASLMVPILAAVGLGMGSALDGMGGVKTLLVGVAFTSSLGMILPISTPPNALAYSTGFIKLRDMQVVGLIIGILGLVIGFSLLIFVN
jgi:anion transporter